MSILNRCRRVGPKQGYLHRQLEKFLQSTGSHGSRLTSSRTEWFPPALTPCTTATDRRSFFRDHRVGIRLQQRKNTSSASPKVCPNFMQLGINFSHHLHIAVTRQNPAQVGSVVSLMMPGGGGNKIQILFSTQRNLL